jgi:hypothetical protein
MLERTKLAIGYLKIYDGFHQRAKKHEKINYNLPIVL